MTQAGLEELKKQKTFFTFDDIMKIFDCGVGLAYNIINRIKKYNDSLSIKGKVTISDFENWYNQKKLSIE